METVATCSTTDSNGSYHGLAPSFFEEMTRCRHQKHCLRWPDNPMVHRNSANIACTFRFYVSLCLCDRDCCSMADSSGSCHVPAPSYFEEITHCRRQKLHWRWRSNPNGRSKFRNLGLFTFTWSQLTLRRRLCGWWRLPEIAQTARIRRQKHRRDVQDWSKFLKYENLCLQDQAKRVEKLLFSCYERHCALFFSSYHSQRLLFSFSKNNFSTTLIPTENRDIHIVEILVDSIYSKTIDILRKKNYFFYL